MKYHLVALLLIAIPAFAIDGDGDGVDDALDACPATAASKVVDADGCSIDDRCPCAGPMPGAPWLKHGKYVSCVTHAVNGFADQGLIPRSAKGGIISTAARSGRGKKEVEVTEALTIITYDDDPAFPAGAGVLIFIDGVEVGATGLAGTLTVKLTANREYRVRALSVGLAGGTATIFLKPSDTGTQALEIIMKGEGAAEDAKLVVEGVAGGVLDAGFSALALRFENAGGGIAPLAFFDDLFLRSPVDEDFKIEVTRFFNLAADGRLLLADLPAFRSALLSLPPGRVTIEAYGQNARGFVYRGTAGFFVGRFRLSGVLQAPPSNPGLAVGGLTIEARFLRSRDVVRSTVAAADAK